MVKICDLCKRDVQNKSALEVHMRTHTNDEKATLEEYGAPIECHKCKNTYTSKEQLEFKKDGFFTKGGYYCRKCEENLESTLLLDAKGSRYEQKKEDWDLFQQKVKKSIILSLRKKGNERKTNSSTVEEKEENMENSRKLIL